MQKTDRALSRFLHALPVAAALLGVGLAPAACGSDDAEAPAGDARSGEALYRAMCVSCHGAAGQGGIGPKIAPWTGSTSDLAGIIDDRMPADDPGRCDRKCAEDIAAYIVSGFASSCGESYPPRGLRLLNRREYNATVRDLFQQPSSGAACEADEGCDVGHQSCVAGACSDDPCGLHTFVYDPGSTSPGDVVVSGSFNDWAPTAAEGAWVMTYLPAKQLFVTKHSLATGTYEYKLVVDGTTWISDPANPVTTGDYGNSVLTLSCSGGGGGTAAMVPSNFAKDFPVESRPTGYPYDNNGDAGIVTAEHVEQYRKAAAELADAATADLGSLVSCDPAQDAAGCARELVQSFGKRAFRRPLTEAEVSKYTGLVTAQADFETGAGVALRVMLSSPYFLYRFELGAPAAGGGYRLTPYETATALSYMLWGTMPDEALFDAAEKGDLGSAAGIETQARRLVADSRARPVLETFALQWLGVESVLSSAKDPALFPEFGDETRTAMAEETKRFVSHVVFDSTRRFDELLTADYGFANQALASIYGVAGVSGTELQQVSLPPERRAGLLAEGGVLARFAYSNQSSPIHRGLFVRRNLLCQTFPTPPKDVPPAPQPAAGATTRERFAAHTANEACKSCHQFIDDVGFGFEHFDAIGRYRDSDEGKPVDAAGDMNDIEGLGTGTHAPFSSLPELGAELAASDSARACFALQTYRFATGRLETEADLCALQGIDQRFAESGYDIQELLVAIATSPAFTTRN